MKKIVLLVCLLMLVKPILPVFQYIANYEYIKNELCVNREITVMGCNGKCYLVKELAKASESEKPISSDKKHVITENTDLFFESVTGYDLAFANTTNEQQHAAYANFYTRLDVVAFFHPPAFIS